MTASIVRPAPADPLRLVEAALLGAMFLGAVATLSLPPAGGAWLWLLAASATALATSRGLRLSARRAGVAARPAAAVAGRRRAAPAARRRRSSPRRASRLLAALALR